MQIMQRSRKYPGLVFAISLALLVLLAAGVVHADDTTPPYLANPSPLDGATNVPSDAAIVVTVADDESSVDSESIEVIIEGIIIEPIIEPAGQGDFDLVYFPSTPFEPGTVVDVVVRALDEAENQMEDDWSFTIAVTGATGGVGNLYPPQNYTLAFDPDSPSLMFSWTLGTLSGWFDLWVQLPGESAYSLRLGPEQYESFLGMGTFEVEVDREAWDYLSRLGEMDWAIQAVDGAVGQALGPATDWWSFRFAPTDAVVIRTPLQGAILRTDTPAIFQWDSDPEATGYLFGFARLDGAGGYSDLHTEELEPWITSLHLTEENWPSFPEGDWIWTVVSRRSVGEVSSYMAGRYQKVESP